MLAKAGYVFDLSQLDDWEVEAYSIIENTLAIEQEAEIKRASKKRK